MRSNTRISSEYVISSFIVVVEGLDLVGTGRVRLHKEGPLGE